MELTYQLEEDLTISDVFCYGHEELYIICSPNGRWVSGPTLTDDFNAATAYRDAVDAFDKAEELTTRLIDRGASPEGAEFKVQGFTRTQVVSNFKNMEEK